MDAAYNGSWNGARRFRGPLFFLARLNTASRGVQAALFVVLLSLIAPPAPAAGGDDDITRLIRHGAPQLAQRLIDRYQAEAAGDAAESARWEKHRIALHIALEQWEAVIAGADALPADARDDLHKWTQTRAAEAELAMGRPAAARERLARLIWAKEESLSANQLAEWRRLVIETYLAEQRADEAGTALQRYQQDTPEFDAEETRLAARVLLTANRAAEAAELLVSHADPESRALNLLADLRAQTSAPGSVAAQARALARDAAIEASTRRRLWAVAAEAMRLSGDELARIEDLENAVSLGYGAAGEMLAVDADLLWDAYLRHGTALAQRAQLRIEDTAPWLDIESRLRAVKPMEARALMAALILLDPVQSGAAGAHQRFVAAFENTAHDRTLLRALYLHSARFPSLDLLPAGVRYSLAALALNEGDLPAATRLMGDLSVPPLGTEAAAWQLLRARVLLASGSDELGISVLHDVLALGAALTPAQRQELLRAAGVVQGLGQHSAALELWQGLAALTPEMDMQRELQFWAGQSYDALEDYQRAALSYLRVAFLAGEEGARDSWGQLGRFHAAAALERAGLAADARRLYAGLLGEDTDPARRAYALRALDQLGGK